eukprot:CAMPEP_0117671990 /NCGR_PEP_ID=MMETSP0804-20121206/13654_1 /TAXON_ID=1074897 /ORGANISM="Tetraselmis astigmatica, Strain CCMP880" /LENGTH=186 /DNA_ID=CAMNT_0005480539 /DNA_START=137 /DNA_END=697 /DNA_ORIENTATION=+
MGSSNIRSPPKARVGLDAVTRQPKLVARSTPVPSDNELEEMRRVASGQLEPSTDIKIKALVDLAKQEWGLYGVPFSDLLTMVNDAYVELPVEYKSGAGTPDEVVNPPGTNSGSRKVFYLAKLHGLTEEETLRLFCEHSIEVKDNPNGDSHANIRAFMKHGWPGIHFAGPALQPRASGATNAPPEGI